MFCTLTAYSMPGNKIWIHAHANTHTHTHTRTLSLTFSGGKATDIPLKHWTDKNLESKNHKTVIQNCNSYAICFAEFFSSILSEQQGTDQGSAFLWDEGLVLSLAFQSIRGEWSLPQWVFLKLWCDACIIPFSVTQCDPKAVYQAWWLDLYALLTSSSSTWTSKDQVKTELSHPQTVVWFSGFLSQRSLFYLFLYRL